MNIFRRFNSKKINRNFGMKMVSFTFLKWLVNGKVFNGVPDINIVSNKGIESDVH